MRLLPSLFAFSHVFVLMISVSSAEAQPKRRSSPSGSSATTPNVSAGASSPQDALRPMEVRESSLRTGTFKWDAFIDAEVRIPSKDNLNGQTIERGATLNDAALFLSKESGPAIFFVELPFRSDLSGATNSFTFADQKAQAYIQYNRWSPLMLRFGQYASFFGIEPNDSRDRLLADAGFIKEYMLPKTHTGIQVGSSAQAFSFRGQITNPNSANAMAKESPEFAFLGRFDGGPGYGAFGLSLNEAKTGANNKTNMLIEIMGGVTVNKFKIDAEIDIKKTAGSDKTANALGLFGNFPIDDLMAVGGRFEYLKDVFVPGGTGTYESIISFAAGPAYKLQRDLTVRGDFTLGSLKTATADETLFALNFSVVAEL